MLGGSTPSSHFSPLLGLVVNFCYVAPRVGVEPSFPSVGSSKHKVLEVGLLKGHVQLKELPISPFGGTRLERSSLSLSTRVVGAADISKTCSPGSGGYGRVTGFV